MKNKLVIIILGLLFFSPKICGQAKMKIKSIKVDSVSTTIEGTLIIRKKISLPELELSQLNYCTIDKKYLGITKSYDSLQNLPILEPILFYEVSGNYRSFRSEMINLLPYIDTSTCTISPKLDGLVRNTQIDSGGACLTSSYCINDDNVNLDKPTCFNLKETKKREKFQIIIRAINTGNHGKLSKNCVLLIPWKYDEKNKRMINLVVKVRFSNRVKKQIKKHF